MDYETPVCDKCKREWAGDYPVCMMCAPETHFPDRTNCIHCEMRAELGITVDAATLRKLNDWIAAERQGPTGWAIVDLAVELARFAELHNVKL